MTQTNLTVAVPVSPEGMVGHSWGKAPLLAIAEVANGRITSWTVHQVDWDRLHDEGGEGSHHARVVRFIKDHGVTLIVASHMGPPMANTLTKLGCRVVLGSEGDARAAVLAAAEG